LTEAVLQVIMDHKKVTNEEEINLSMNICPVCIIYMVEHINTLWHAMKFQAHFHIDISSSHTL